MVVVGGVGGVAPRSLNVIDGFSLRNRNQRRVRIGDSYLYGGKGSLEYQPLAAFLLTD